eukprot:TRINITY_DN15435_c0_g1_i1.p1 TRINITY_DN15435_c0_g1~~TRINITY_DN15435_c0_g1_i1.p1  ORF type:complete len:216 (-),score=48.06 TRINITY_DN15435_c0_g1_i1:113-718(-)
MAQDLLLRAAQHGDIEEAALLMEKGRALPAVAMPPSNTTPLHAACRAGNLDMVELLLAAKAEPNMKEIVPCGGRTALHVAAKENFTAIATRLLAAGADPLIRDARGSTPLHIAAQEGQADVTQLLVSHGADPNVRDFSGFNAAWWAKEFKHQDVLEFYASIQVAPLKITATERLAFSGIRLKVAPKKKAKGKDRDKSRGRK